MLRIPQGQLLLMAFRAPYHATERKNLDEYRYKIDAYVRKIAAPGDIPFGTGACRLCQPQQCARTSGEQCRYPQLAMPSLQACGFNLVQTASELMGITMQWGPDAQPVFIAAVLRQAQQ